MVFTATIVHYRLWSLAPSLSIHSSFKKYKNIQMTTRILPAELRTLWLFTLFQEITLFKVYEQVLRAIVLLCCRLHRKLRVQQKCTTILYYTLLTYIHIIHLCILAVFTTIHLYIIVLVCYILLARWRSKLLTLMPLIQI